MIAIAWVLAGLVLGMPVTLRAQATRAGVDTTPPGASAATPDSLRLLRPGDAAFDSRHLQTDTTQYRLVLFREGSQFPVGQLIDEMRRDSSTQGVWLRRVQRVQRGSMQLIDSSVTDAGTLAPRSHASLQPTRRVALEFTGRRVRGRVGPVDAPTVPFDTVLPLPVFDAGNWDLLVRALPLAKGYAARLAVFDVDGGLRAYQIRVTGRTEVQGEDAHVVILTLARGRESVVWVGATSGRILRIETMLNATTMLLQERVQVDPVRDVR